MAETLVNRVVPANEDAPLSVAAGKAMVYGGMGQPRNVAFETAERLCEPAYLSNDAQEGPRAFREGRAPKWTGT